MKSETTLTSEHCRKGKKRKKEETDKEKATREKGAW
jgi:hypothetical protein